MFNAHYDSWRRGRRALKDLDLSPRFGTIAWLFERYWCSSASERVHERSRPEYFRALFRVEDVPTHAGGTVGDLPVASISARAADRIYEAWQRGPRGKRVRQANLSIDMARRAWKIMQRLHPRVVPWSPPLRVSSSAIPGRAQVRGVKRQLLTACARSGSGPCPSCRDAPRLGLWLIAQRFESSSVTWRRCTAHWGRWRRRWLRRSISPFNQRIRGVQLLPMLLCKSHVCEHVTRQETVGAFQSSGLDARKQVAPDLASSRLWEFLEDNRPLLWEMVTRISPALSPDA